MTEERSLVANLVPKLDDEALNSMMAQLNESLTSTVQVATEVTESAQPQVQETPTTAETESVDQRTQEILDTVNTEMQEVNQTLQDIEEIQVDLLDAYDSATVVTEDGEKEQKGFWDKLLSGDKEKGEGLSDLKGNVMAGLGVIRMVFGILDEFIRKFRRSSPLLDNVLSLIENAWNLIMAPIMTAIGIELIPLVETIYEKVFKIVQTMWEVYESEGIVGMIMVAIDGAFDIFCAIIEKVLEMFMGKETLDNIKGFVNSITKWMPEGMTFSSLIKDVISSVGKLFNPLPGSSNSAMDLNNLFWQGVDWLTGLGKGAEGGYVEASPTGTPMILGEAGEREYIIPESKVTSFANQYTTNRPVTNGNTINVYVNGYTDSDLGDKIITVLNTRTELSNLRGGF